MKEYGIIKMGASVAKLMNECFKPQAATEGRVKLTNTSDTRMIIDVEVKAKEYGDAVHLWKEASRKVSSLESELGRERAKLSDIENKMFKLHGELVTTVAAEGTDSNVGGVKSVDTNDTATRSILLQHE